MDIEYLKETIERRLCFFLSEKKVPEALYEFMSYYPLQGGKRIRPLFVVLTALNLNGNVEDAVTVGCCIELIHNYSLVHDDLPAMDNDDYRRGKPTCHKVFGEANAILTGDALLSYAFQLLSERSLYRSLDDSQLIDIISVIAKKAGIWGMVLGQIFDINGYEDVIETNKYKTSALFEACFMCGGIVAGRYDILDKLEKLGSRVGLLFQFTDDLLDKDGVYRLGYGYVIEEIRHFKDEALEMLTELMPNDTEIIKLINLIENRVS